MLHVRGRRYAFACIVRRKDPFQIPAVIEFYKYYFRNILFLKMFLEYFEMRLFTNASGMLIRTLETSDGTRLCVTKMLMLFLICCTRTNTQLG